MRVWDIETGHCARVLKGHGGSVLCLAYDATELFTGSSDACVFVWDLVGNLRTGKGKWEVKRKLLGHTQGVLDLTFDDKVVVSCSKVSAASPVVETDMMLINIAFVPGHDHPGLESRNWRPHASPGGPSRTCQCDPAARHDPRVRLR